jgi:hypothetical protein
MSGFEPMFCAGAIETITFGTNGIDIAFIPMLGYGTGIGAGAAGVKHTSGKPMFIPTP